jgi:hypothetical protein
MADYRSPDCVIVPRGPSSPREDAHTRAFGKGAMSLGLSPDRARRTAARRTTCVVLSGSAILIPA